MQQPTDACSWLPHRFNVVAFGIVGHRLPSQFVDSLEQAFAAKTEMQKLGAEDIRIYDTVDGLFYD